jgi:hypothetical protein
MIKATGGFLSAMIFVTAIASLIPNVTYGQIFVADNATGTIGEYTTLGATINAALITGLGNPQSLAVSGGDIFVLNGATGTIGEYTTSGQAINPSLITGLTAPVRIAVSGGNLFVTDAGAGPVGSKDGTIREYTASGALVNASLVSGLDEPSAIAVSGNDIYVLGFQNGTVGEYTTSGATVNPALITDQFGATSLAVSGSNLLVSNPMLITVSEYTTGGTLVNPYLTFDPGEAITVSGSTMYVANEDQGRIGAYSTGGQAINQELVSGLHQPVAIAVVPEAPTVISTTGTLNLSPMPGDLRLGAYESNSAIQVIAEQSNVQLKSALAVDISVPSSVPSSASLNLTPGVIPAGTHVASTLLHFDPVGVPAQPTALSGSVTFSTPILGIEILTSSLNSSDSQLGLSSTFYPVTETDRGLELAVGQQGFNTFDGITFSPDDRTVSVLLSTQVSLDEIRIITAVPEPASIALVGIGGCGLLIFAILRRKAG